MKPNRRQHTLNSLLTQLRTWLKRKAKDPEEPFAMVGATKKPRTPLHTLGAKAKPEESV